MKEKDRERRIAECEAAEEVMHTCSFVTNHVGVATQKLAKLENNCKQ